MSLGPRASTIGLVLAVSADPNVKEPKSMAGTQSNDPLKNFTLETIMHKLVNKYGWDGLARRVDLNCFKGNPSIAQSVKFLCKTPWARKKVEALFINSKLWTRG